MRVPDGKQLRNPILRIGRDATNARVAYTDLNGTTLGTYVATSNGVVSADPTVASVAIIALSNGTVDILASAEVRELQGDDTWGPWSAQTSFASVMDFELTSACGACIDGDTQIIDTDGGPVITAIPVPLLPSGTTTTTLTGTVLDMTTIIAFTVNGQPAGVGEDGSFSASVTNLVAGDNIVTLTATDCVGNTTTQTVTITVEVDLCEGIPLYDQCTADNVGSVFNIAVTNGTSNCHIVCQTGANGQALTCDPNPVCP